jgi:hypothetical protein
MQIVIMVWLLRGHYRHPADRNITINYNNSKTNSRQHCISVTLFQASMPGAKNGCGIIVGYCYAPEFSGRYCPI